VAISADGSRAVSAGDDGTVTVWDLTTATAILRRRTWAVNGVAISADGSRAVSAGDDGTVKAWDVTTGAVDTTLSPRRSRRWFSIRYGGHKGRVNGVAISADGSRAVSAGDDGTVRMWDLTTGTGIGKLEGHIGPARGVAISADGSLAVSGGYDRTVRVWDVMTSNHLATFTADGPVDSVAIAADTVTIVAGDRGGAFHGLKLQTIDHRTGHI
jgi:WD40 repeat protein